MDKNRRIPSLQPLIVPQQKQLLKGSIEVGTILQFTPSQLAQWIEDLEKNPIFIKLFSEKSESRVIRRKKLNRTSLATQFYELPENLPDSSGSVDVEGILDSKKNLVTLIQKIGSEKFERYFLNSEDGVTLEEIASRCQISLEQVDEIRELLNKIYLQDEILNPTQIPTPSIGLSYFKIARILKEESSDLSIAFYSPRMAQGLYEVDHKKLQELKKQKIFDSAEKKQLRDLLYKIHLINVFKNSLYQLILNVLDIQKDFILTDDPEKLNILAQKKIALELNLSPSSVSRLIQGRSLETVSGKEVPIERLFYSRKDWVKLRLENCVLPESKDWTDIRLAQLIQEKYGVSLSRRSVNQYRNELRR